MSKQVAWRAFRDDPLLITMLARGADLDAATELKYLVGATAASAPLLTLNKTVTVGALGVRVTDVSVVEGLTQSTAEIFVPQVDLDAALAGFAEGADVVLYHKFQWTLAGGVDTTIFYGPLTMMDGTNG